MRQLRIAITGAGSGLGKRLANKLMEQGHHIILLGRTKDKLKRIAEKSNGESSVFTLDISDKASVENVFNSIHEQHGHIDILINNAGTGTFGLAENLHENDINKMIDINLKGTIFCTQEVLPMMKQKNSGMLINIVSTAGKVGKANETVYCASKFGVRGFTESLVIELAKTNIKVVGVYMGGMKTEFWTGILDENQMDQMMDPEDVADIVIESIKSRPNVNIEEIVIKNKKKV